MKKHILFAVLFSAFMAVSAQKSPEEYIDIFFQKVGESEYTAAIKLMPVSERMENDTSVVGRLLDQLGQSTESYGEYCGYELISKEEVSPSFITFTYFIKYEDAPQRIQFVFYMPKEAWQVNRINLVGSSARRNARNRFRM